MIKRLLYLLIIIFYVVTPCYAKEDIIDVNEKLGYVNMNFWNRLGDDYLSCYIQQAVINNHDVRKASYRVEEYRQQVKMSFSRELPMLTMGANYFGAHVPQLDNQSNYQIETSGFILPFIANYEADILLKNRDKTKSQKKYYEAAKDEEKSIYISLAGDVGATYINIIKFDRMIELQQKIIANQSALYKKTKLRYLNGISTKLELNDTEKRLYDVQNELIELEQNRRNALYQLAILIGENPECICDFKRANIDDFAKNYIPPEEISSDVIFSRPDVLASEKKLERAKIDIRVARKEFLPRFNITAFWIFNTLTPGTFFSWESSIAAIIAGASQDIFVGGRKIANLKAKQAVYHQLFEEYKQTDLIAIKEVSSSLCIMKDNKKSYNNLVAKTVSENANFGLTQKKYNEGVVSQMDLLTGANKVYEVNKVLINKKAMRYIDYITLYKAVGAQL